jgi:hypothetical protein
LSTKKGEERGIAAVLIVWPIMLSRQQKQKQAKKAPHLISVIYVIF